MPDIAHGLRSLCTRCLALLETAACSAPCQTAKMELCGRIIIPFN